MKTGCNITTIQLPAAFTRVLRYFRRWATFAAVTTAACFGSLFTSLPVIHAQSGQSQTDQQTASQNAARQEYAEKVAKTYNFAFGKSKISTPGNAAVEG